MNPQFLSQQLAPTGANAFQVFNGSKQEVVHKDVLDTDETDLPKQKRRLKQIFYLNSEDSFLLGNLEMGLFESNVEKMSMFVFVLY
jgi:hypothetical protein